MFSLISLQINALKFSKQPKKPASKPQNTSVSVDPHTSEPPSSESNSSNERLYQKSKSQRRNRSTLQASEIRQESKDSIVSCEYVTVREEFADCVINNLSLEFFFTAFVYYKRKFKKNYGSVFEENRRFQIFMRNYQKILK